MGLLKMASRGFRFDNDGCYWGHVERLFDGESDWVTRNLHPNWEFVLSDSVCFRGCPERLLFSAERAYQKERGLAVLFERIELLCYLEGIALSRKEGKTVAGVWVWTDRENIYRVGSDIAKVVEYDRDEARRRVLKLTNGDIWVWIIDNWESCRWSFTKGSRYMR